MKVLFIVPYAKFNYKAPFTPIGMLSIATYLKQHGHTVKIVDRVFEKVKIDELIESYKPGAVCVTVQSVRVLDDAVFITKSVKKHNITVIWGGNFISGYSDQALAAGLPDFLTLGEGEINTLNLINALQNGEDVKNVKGIAYARNGEVVYTEPQPLANLADLPIIDFTLCPIERYLHRYIYCERMMYIYSTKGCASRCTFCSNPRYHCYTYRVRPINYVISEIKYLYENYHIDGVYFSDENWYINRKDMLEFCRQLEEENIHIVWGCEIRVNTYSVDDLKFMYEHGCRWVTFGIESGDQTMLNRIKKGTTLEMIERAVLATKDIGITAISNFIVGYPDETREQVQSTIDLAKRLDSGVTSFTIFTPIPGSEMCDELVNAGIYKIADTLEDAKKSMFGEYSPYTCNTIPLKELKVIRDSFLWHSFTKKNTSKSSKSFEVALNSIKDAFDNLTRLGFLNLIPGLFLIAKEFIPVFYYAHFFPGIRKKYNITFKK